MFLFCSIAIIPLANVGANKSKEYREYSVEYFKDFENIEPFYQIKLNLSEFMGECDATIVSIPEICNDLYVYGNNNTIKTLCLKPNCDKITIRDLKFEKFTLILPKDTNFITDHCGFDYLYYNIEQSCNELTINPHPRESTFEHTIFKFSNERSSDFSLNLIFHGVY